MKIRVLSYFVKDEMFEGGSVSIVRLLNHFDIKRTYSNISLDEKEILPKEIYDFGQNNIIGESVMFQRKLIAEYNFRINDMDFKKLYQSFKIYNRENSYDSLPVWASIYDKDEPPIYWKCLKKRVENLPKEYRIVEIGSGFGGVTFLLAALGFKEVVSIEREPKLIEYSKNLLSYLELKNFKAICGSYPIDLGKIDVLVSVNCVYWDGISTREEYLQYIRYLFDFSGAKVFILEVIDKSFKAESSFPDFVKVSETEIHKIFFDCECTSELTFQYPNDKTTKRMFTIIKNFFA